MVDLSNAAVRSTATQTVRCGGFLWLKPVAISLVSCSKAEVVECPGQKPCWSSKTTDVIPYLCTSILSKIEWSIVSNAELKSIITNRAPFLESIASLILFVTHRSAVSVEWCFLYAELQINTYLTCCLHDLLID